MLEGCKHANQTLKVLQKTSTSDLKSQAKTTKQKHHSKHLRHSFEKQRHCFLM